MSNTLGVKIVFKNRKLSIMHMITHDVRWQSNRGIIVTLKLECNFYTSQKITGFRVYGITGRRTKIVSKIKKILFVTSGDVLHIEVAKGVLQTLIK